MIGVLFSGGVDSSVLILFLMRAGIKFKTFTIGNNGKSPDVVAAMRLSKEWALSSYFYFPSPSEIQDAYSKYHDHKGDWSVFLALKFASRFCDTILATDGIDELTGGYWWHYNRNEEYPTIESAFQYFQDRLEPDHLAPMQKIAEDVGIGINFIFLSPEIVKVISEIPLVNRVKNGPKSFWKEFAFSEGVPEWVVNRQKRGFCDALEVKNER